MAFAAALVLGGCAASAVRESAPTTQPTMELDMRRIVEVVGSRGELRLLGGSLRVEYRAGRSGPGLDAGVVTLGGLTLEPSSRGGEGARVHYRSGSDQLLQLAAPGSDGNVPLVHSGTPATPPGTIPVRLAPLPAILQPVYLQSIWRTEGFAVVTEEAGSDVWHRVTLEVEGRTAEAIPIGPGRWEFRPASLADLAPGRARLRIEVETTCGDCPGSEPYRARWTTRTELELPLTLG